VRCRVRSSVKSHLVGHLIGPPLSDTNHCNKWRTHAHACMCAKKNDAHCIYTLPIPQARSSMLWWDDPLLWTSLRVRGMVSLLHQSPRYPDRNPRIEPCSVYCSYQKPKRKVHVVDIAIGGPHERLHERRHCKPLTQRDAIC
jgi:hypothetical protein